MIKTTLNPDQTVDRIFPGRNTPIIFLWILLGALSGYIYGESGSIIFRSAMLVILLAISVTWVLFSKPAAALNISSQLLVFSAFAIGHTILPRPTGEHYLLMAAMLALLVITLVRRVDALPLGPALLFIAMMISAIDPPLILLMAFPTLLIVTLIAHFGINRPMLPPLVSLSAGAIYLIRLSYNGSVSGNVALVAIIFSLVLLIYAFRYSVSRSLSNARIHIVEDIICYFLLLALLRIGAQPDPLIERVILTVSIFLLSLLMLTLNEKPQFISTATVALLSLIPILDLQIPSVTDLKDLVLKSLPYGFIGLSAAILSRLDRARVPNHLAKLMFVVALGLIFIHINPLHSNIRANENLLLGSTEVAAILILTLGLTLIGGFVSHSDLHLRNENIWGGVISKRLLVAGRRLYRSTAVHSRSLPFLGFAFTMSALVLDVIRRAFGLRDRLET